MFRDLRCVLAIVAVLVCLRPATAGVFADVPFNHWAYQAAEVICAARGETLYAPRSCSQAMTRYEFAVYALRAYAELDTTLRGRRPDSLGGQKVTTALWRLTTEFSREIRAMGVNPTDILAVLSQWRASGGRLALPRLTGTVIGAPEAALCEFAVDVDVDGAACAVHGDAWSSYIVGFGEHVVTVSRGDGAPLAVYAVTLSADRQPAPILTQLPLGAAR